MRLWTSISILLALAIGFSVSAQELEQPRNEAASQTAADHQISVVAPKVLRPNGEFPILVTLAKSKSPASVELQIDGAKDSSQELSEAKSLLVQPGETQTVKFAVGDWPRAEYILSVRAQAVDRSWNFSQEHELIYQPKSFIGLIQTDKPIYKANQLVQLRVLFLSQNLLPLALSQGINVTILDPHKNVVKFWPNLANYRGLLSLELPLSDDPIFGHWTIRVSAADQRQKATSSPLATHEFSTRFLVTDYILPTFDIQIHLPKFTTYNKSKITAIVEAKYTYGRPVSGHVTLTVQPLVRYAKILTRPLHQAQFRSRIEASKGGRAEFQIDLLDDLKQQRDLFERQIEFFALVEEDFTGRKYNRTKVMKIYDKEVKMELLQPKSAIFKPGLDCRLQLKVARQDDTPAEGLELVELSYGVQNSDFNDSVRLRPVGGIIEHTIRVPRQIQIRQQPDSGQDQDTYAAPPTTIELRAHYRGQVHHLRPLKSFASDSGQHLQISLVPPNSTGASRSNKPTAPPAKHQISDQVRVRLDSTEPLGDQLITCQGLARGSILWVTQPSGAASGNRFEFDVQLEDRMAPELTIVCFYVRHENNELIADSLRLPVDGLMARNPIKLRKSHDEAKPGQRVQVEALTRPSSLVGVAAVDQSVLLASRGDDDTKLSAGRVNRELNSYDHQEDDRGESPSVAGGEEDGARNAAKLFADSQLLVMTNSLVYDSLGHRLGHLINSGSLSAIGRKPVAGLQSERIVLDPLLLDRQIQPPTELRLGGRDEQQQQQRQLELVRQFFPESWLWQNGTANAAGRLEFEAKVPDSITSWQLSAFSLHEQFGLGLTNDLEPANKLRVFKQFFVRLNLPASIIRGELLNLQVLVFNYMKKRQEAKVSLANENGEFEFVDFANLINDEEPSNLTSGSQQQQTVQTQRVSAPANGVAAAQVNFLIRPMKLGQMELRVEAAGEYAGDILVARLQVKAEGQTQHFSRSILIELSGDQQQQQQTFKQNVTIPVPANAVAGSRRVQATLIGDLLGPSLSHADELLALPAGSSEQNLVQLAANVIILKYLEQGGQLRDIQRARALKNIELAYQRQLKFRLADGSFSSLGAQNETADGDCSRILLTGYVLKTLHQAAPMLRQVDDQVVRQAELYLAKCARPDGSIGEPAASAEQSLHSTAYSLAALLERWQTGTRATGTEQAAERELLANVIERAAQNVAAELADTSADRLSSRDLALATYALHLAAQRHQLIGGGGPAPFEATMNEAYARLWSRAADAADGQQSWWRHATDHSEAPQPPAATEREAAELRAGDSSADRPPARLQHQHQHQPPLKPVKVAAGAPQSAHRQLPSALAVETGAYVLLTAIQRTDFHNALKIVRWLVSQQNANGGFASSQDTALAIESLAKFARIHRPAASKPSMDLEFVFARANSTGARPLPSFRSNLASEQLLLSNQNELVLQRLHLPEHLDWCQVTASGRGLAVVQLDWQFNLLVSAEQPAFYLNPLIDRSSSSSYLQLSICTFYRGPGEWSNMALVDLELPSGFVADLSSLDGLAGESAGRVRRVETSDGDTRVLLYLDKVGHKQELCFTVAAHRVAQVAQHRPVPVTIYDYYERQRTARIFYEPPRVHLCEICPSDECRRLCLERSLRAPTPAGVSLHAQRRAQLVAANSTAG